MDYLKCLKKDVDRNAELERKNRELEHENRIMMMKLEKLEKLEQNFKTISFDQQKTVNSFDDNNNSNIYRPDLNEMNFNNLNDQQEFNPRQTVTKSNQQLHNNQNSMLQLNQHIKQEYFDTPASNFNLNNEFSTMNNTMNSNQLNSNSSSNYMPNLSNLVMDSNMNNNSTDNFSFDNGNNFNRQLHKQSQNNSNKLLSTIKSEVSSPHPMDVCL